ncbi:unnamed protein product [Heterobilharzia americana]|nr:unnamed protein product [Heterobilharzia americana]
MADFLFRTTNSYVILSEFQICPTGGLYFSFLSASSTGLLLYTENNETGQFFALTLLPGNRIKLEMELRPPQYRVTRAHTTMTLDYSKHIITNPNTQSFTSRFSSNLNHWNTVEVSFQSKTNHTIDLITLRINEFHTQKQLIPSINFSPIQFYAKTQHSIFDEMRSDATERALFSAAMQPSFQGIIKYIYSIQCIDSEYSVNKDIISYTRQCKVYEIISLENGALYFESNLNSPIVSSCSLKQNSTKRQLQLTNDVDTFGNNRLCGKDSHSILNLNGRLMPHFILIQWDTMKIFI